MADFITCKQVVKAFQVGGHEIVALRGIDFEMARGEMIAIIGPSGAGKSTMLNLLGGLDTPTAGQLVVDGQNLLELRGRRLADYRLRRVGFVWQQVDRNLLGHRTALHNVTLPLMLAGVPFHERRRRALDLLDMVGIRDHARRRPAQLSGGQQQRVAVAVALANRPNVLLADEPTGSIDRQNAIQVMKLITDLRQRYGLTILMVTHDMEIAAYADRVLTLRDGALGQDLSGEADAGPQVDGQGRLQLPEAGRKRLADADRITVEIRPEGVLLRPEEDDLLEETESLLFLEEEPPTRNGRHARGIRRWLRRGNHT
jgi:ABC-type lipoprotein export system ATPase subunit